MLNIPHCLNNVSEHLSEELDPSMQDYLDALEGFIRNLRYEHTNAVSSVRGRQLAGAARRHRFQSSRGITLA